MQQPISVGTSEVTTRAPRPEEPRATRRLRARIAAERPRAEVAAAPARIDAVDFARGLAILLMILSHGVKGLLGYEQIPAWGLVPVHLVTKFSSSLFILVFGMSLAIAFVPAIGTDRWPAKRNRLFLRGIVVLFWYKLLTVIEMLYLHEPEEIIATLEYRRFPVFVEILGFYGIALLWIPFALPLWKRCPVALQLAAPFGLGVIWYDLYTADYFRGNLPLRAILLEEDGLYVWGQLARGPLIFLGLLVGGLVLAWREKPWAGVRLGGVFLLLAGAFAAGFFWFTVGADRARVLESIARNLGKHPPELGFMLFSVGGAFACLALAFFGGNRLASWLRPITIIGKNALSAFVFHIFVIFLFYRYLLHFWRLVDYEDALLLTGALMVMTAVWVSARRFLAASS